MAHPSLRTGDHTVLDRAQLGQLVNALSSHGYRIVGPTVRDGAIVYDELASIDDLPVGWTDRQDAGIYQLMRRDDAALFGYAVGPHSWKRFLHPPSIRLWRAERTNGTWSIASEPEPAPRWAFLGVRSCELHAIAIQDRVFLHGAYADPTYRARRESLFLIAVNCGQAGGTCFCASMQTGPKATTGFDLALTEIVAANRHEFVVEIGSAAGAEILSAVPHRPAEPDDIQAADRIVLETTRHMGRTMPTDGLRELLTANIEHPRWSEVAARCLACANCTMVCPTCFCTTVEDVTDLTSEHAERWRRWDSCFTLDFSYIHGGSVRASTRARYRQWLTHKLATWIDQFGTSGCVGCGRCISWCPAAIDLTEEVRAIRSRHAQSATVASTKEKDDANA